MNGKYEEEIRRTQIVPGFDESLANVYEEEHKLAIMLVSCKVCPGSQRIVAGNVAYACVQDRLCIYSPNHKADGMNLLRS